MPNAPGPSGDRPLVSQFANDPDMSELVELFVSELPGRIEALIAAWTGRRITELTRMAHQLKGAGAGYGFPTIGQAAGALEARLRGLPAPGPDAAIEAMAREFKALVDLCSRACVPGR
jgi:HPt (histidine-containing phosphotransfer) domain-containing protein